MEIKRLFVYGTLAPNRPNAHILEPLGGEWQKGNVRGKLHHEGWGAGMGYPGFTIDNDGEEIEGFLLTADALSSFWHELDTFEGLEYRRVVVPVTLENNTVVDAYIYALNK